MPLFNFFFSFFFYQSAYLMWMSWKYQQSSNFSFVLDDEFITGLPLPNNISTSTDILSISNRTRPFSITFKSETDSLYKVEASENLRQWSTIKEIRARKNTTTFTDIRRAIFKKQY